MTRLRARALTLAVSLLVVLHGAACGGPPSPATHATVQLDGGASDAAAASTVAIDDGSMSLEALAARGPTDAPLMRELLRVERAAPRSPDVKAERDQCVRALFSSASPVRIWFVDQSGATRGDATSAASGSVPPRGPVCVKKGDVLHLVVEGEGVRAVIFAAP